MKLFLDTAHIPSIEKWMATGLLDGITTNPSNLSKEGGNPTEIVRRICQLLPEGDISIEVTETDPRAVYEQALRIADIAENVIVKIPGVAHYYDTIARLADQGIPMNITLVFSVSQAIFMAKLGACYVSPFVGRLDQSGADGIKVVTDIRAVYDRFDYETEILAASIRSVEKFEQAVVAGTDCVTMPVEIFEQAMEHPLIKPGMEKFAADWKKLNIIQFP